MSKMDERLEYWTPDQVAECLPVSGKTSGRLWQILSGLEEKGESMPLGGDGSNGTIEMPPEPDAYMSGTMGAIWSLLSEEEQTEINAAAAKELS